MIRGDLRRALKEVRLRPPMSFTAFGHDYTLPFRVKETPLQVPSKEMLAYLSGFFAGDGCVSSDLRELKVGQSVQGAAVLFLFARFFGGSIGVASTGSGTSFPVLQWQVGGSKGHRAAEMLGKLEKQAQLMFFTSSNAGHQTVANFAELWKQMPTVEFQSWQEVAGFVDAEGCFASMRLSSIELRFQQKHRASLEALQRFVLRELGIRVPVSASATRDAHALSISHQSTKMMCKKLLEAGLLQKKA